MFNFGKKRRIFRPYSARQYSASGCRKDSGRARNLRHRFESVKALFLKLAALSAFAGILYLFLFSSFFAVKNITITGNQSVKSEDIKSLVNSSINHRVFKIFTNSLLFIKTADIEFRIKENYGSIEDVRVIKKFPGMLVITITEKPIDISWCNRIKVEKIIEPAAKKSEIGVNSAVREVPPLETSQCYFSDESNVIYEKAGDNPPDSAIKVFVDGKIKIGDKIANDSVKDFIRQLARDFNKKTNLDFAYLYMPPIASREMHVITAYGWKAYFDLNRSVDDQLDVLNGVYKNAIPDSDKKNLDYIDLRVVDKVPWKPK